MSPNEDGVAAVQSSGKAAKKKGRKTSDDIPSKTRTVNQDHPLPTVATVAPATAAHVPPSSVTSMPTHALPTPRVPDSIPYQFPSRPHSHYPGDTGVVDHGHPNTQHFPHSHNNYYSNPGSGSGYQGHSMTYEYHHHNNPPPLFHPPPHYHPGPSSTRHDYPQPPAHTTSGITFPPPPHSAPLATTGSKGESTSIQDPSKSAELLNSRKSSETNYPPGYPPNLDSRPYWNHNPEHTQLSENQSQMRGHRISPVIPGVKSYHPQDSFGIKRDISPDGQIQRPRKKSKDHARRRSIEEEEAGLALAGMGLGLSAGEMRVKRDTLVDDVFAGGEGKVKIEEGKQKGAKETAKKSCSECRRLKAKCDRVFPCSNCRRRGCALVCPDGDLSCMQGKRLVLASTEQLHERISQLEAALQQAHSKNSEIHHPLLAPHMLDGGFAAITTPPDHISPPGLIPSQDTRSPNNRSSEQSFNIVTPQTNIVDHPNQGRIPLESLLLSEDAAAPEGKREDEWVGENAAPAMIVGTVGNAPHEETERHAVVQRLRSILRVLPPREQAERQAESFVSTSIWYNYILRRDETFNTYLPAVYSPTPANPLTPHKLACILMVLTLDTYFDLSTEKESPVIAEYWDGVQKCFDTRFGWAASVAGVQALALASLFVGFGWRGALASNFYWLRLMSSQAQQLGLHKEPHPSLPEEEREFRRRVFYEMYALDCLISINHGQRTAIPIDIVETIHPKFAEPLHKIRWNYMKSVKNAVIDIGCMPDTAPASWEKVSQVHEILTTYESTAQPQYHCPVLTGEPLPPPVEDPSKIDVNRMVRETTSMCHYKAMMFLYRPSLRRLITRIRQTPISQSITLSASERQTINMTYLASKSITTISMDIVRTHPRIAARSWTVWVQAFSAAVSMAALAIWCGPLLEPGFIDTAYQQLVTATEMIASNGSKRAQGVMALLPILKNLVASRYPHLTGGASSSDNGRRASNSSEGEDMLYLLLGGQVDTTSSRSQPPSNPGTQEPFSQPNSHPNSHNSTPDGIAPPSVDYLTGNDLYPQNFAPDHSQTQTQSQAHAQTDQNVQQFIQHFTHAVPETWGDTAIPLINGNINMDIHWANQDFSTGSNTVEYLQQQSSMSQSESQGQGQGQTIDGAIMEGMSATELWARLQTFYDPAPAFWQLGFEGQLGQMGQLGTGINGMGGGMNSMVGGNGMVQGGSMM